MNLRRLIFILFALSVAVPQGTSAQDGPPTIVLDNEPSKPEATLVPDASGGSEPTPRTESVPQIQLPPLDTISSEISSTEVSPVIPQRDRGGDVVPAASQSWLLPLRPTTRLSHLPQMGASQPAPGILRLTGEAATFDLLIDLPLGASLPADLLLTLRSTVNVLPEVATVSVSVNDAEPVVLPLNHLSGFQTVKIPTMSLKAGTNRVRLDLHQPHRIYCGPEASFNVWTEIDLTKSGALMDAGILSPDAAGFALALSAQAATGQALPVLAAEGEDPTLLQQLVEELGRFVGGQVPMEFRSFYELQPSAPLSVALISSERSHAELRNGADGRLVLQVEHLGRQLPPLDALLPKLSSQSNPTPALSPGVPTSLAELSQADIIGNTRYFRHEVPFALPEDWLLLANQKGRLRLNYGFADMLPAGATLLVKMNGETIRLLPLDRNGGRMQEPLDIIFSANLLHSGRNDLAFEMMVPGDPPDAICPQRRADMLVVTRNSTLLVPPAPAMALAGISKVISEVGPREIAVPEGVSDRATLERFAVELGSGLAPQASSPSHSVRLNVVGISDISLIPLERTGVSERELQEPLVGETPLLMASNSVATSREVAPHYQLTEEVDQTAEALDSDAGKSEIRGKPFQLALKDWLALQTQRVRSVAFMGGDESLPTWLQAQQGNALLIRPSLQEPNELWLILGPRSSAQTVRQGLIRLRESGLAKGEAAILRDDGNWQVWTAVRPPELYESLKFSNLRSVVGNYASWSPLLFTVTFLVFTLFSAIPAVLFVLLTRRRGQL